MQSLCQFRQDTNCATLFCYCSYSEVHYFGLLRSTLLCHETSFEREKVPNEISYLISALCYVLAYPGRLDKLVPVLSGARLAIG
jgi:hypothetical protein